MVTSARIAVAGIAVAALVAAPAAAFAETDEAGDTVEHDQPADAGVADHRIDVAAGFRAGVGGAAGQGFDDGESVTDEQGNRIPSPGGSWPRPEYYPHFGVGAGIGPSVEVRYNQVIGLETGLLYSRDNADGYVDKDQNGTTIARIHSEQRTSAFHIPVAIKANARSDSLRPFVSGGLQFVVQSSSQLDYYQEERAGRFADDDIEELDERNQVEPSNYVQAMGSAGIEVVAGDVKIPIELRLGYTIGYGNTMEERARGQDGQIMYDGVYMGQFGVYAGALYEFDIIP